MRAVAGLVLALLGTSAVAQEGIYVGLGLGQFDYEEQFVTAVVGQVADTVSVTKLVGGFEVNEHFSLEINYGKTGEISQSGIYFDPGIMQDVNVAIYTDFTITSFRGVGFVPFEWGALLGGLGYYTANNDVLQTLSSDGFDPFAQEIPFEDDGMTAMLGLEWRFGRFGARYGLRLEYEWWDMSDLDTSGVNLVVTYGF